MKNFFEKKVALKILNSALERYEVMLDRVDVDDKEYYYPSTSAVRRIKKLIEIWEQK